MRKLVVQADGPLVGAVKLAQRTYLKLRREGVSPGDAAAEIAPGLHEALGQAGWPPRCERCLDTGWLEAGVDVGHVYGPDDPVHWVARKCESCGYWERRWQQYLKGVQRGDGDGSEDVATRVGRTRRVRR